ncbi:hypothetical protein [Peribacillus frigoritolerans]
MAGSRRKVSVFPASPEMLFKKKSYAGSLEPSLRLDAPSWFFTVILNGWRKFATLLPKYWLVETPQTLASRRLGRQSAERERISRIT